MIAVIDFGYEGKNDFVKILDELNVEYKLTNSEPDIYKAEKIILLASGEIETAMRKMHISNLVTMLRVTKKPFLGVELGMVLLCGKASDRNICCLGNIETEFNSLKSEELFTSPGFLKVEFNKAQLLLNGIENGSSFYFNSKNYLPVSNYTTAEAFCGVTFSAAIQKNNFHGILFNPEKSGTQGKLIVKNFVEKCV